MTAHFASALAALITLDAKERARLLGLDIDPVVTATAEERDGRKGYRVSIDVWISEPLARVVCG